MKRILIALSIATLVSATASAGEIHNREVRQQKRIAQGVAAGKLTPRETIRLERRQAALNSEVKDWRSDNSGKLTNAEKAKAERQQNRLSKQIYNQKHDGQHQ